MDLKDVVQNVKEKANEAHSAFHAGHQDNARKYLAGIRAEIVQFEQENPAPAGEVTESTTSEKPAESPMGRLAGVPGAPATPAQTPGAKIAQAFGGVLTEPKPSQ